MFVSAFLSVPSLARAALGPLFICLSLVSVQAAQNDSVVAVAGGQIRGHALPENKGVVFKGVPFAAPPVGELRWREPMPVVAWTGVRNASTSGAPSAQASAGWNAAAAAASSEDSLYLDIWTPSLQPAAPKPVMVWIHGGANVAGSGGFDPLYNGTALISHDVILVVIQYRLGIFGFFAHPDLTRESSHHSSGNYAILDQIAALQWVHDNIKQFGGDPSNVTLFGQSAGSMDVSALITSPLAKGLFQRAISESGSAVASTTLTLADAEKEGTATATQLIPASEPSLKALRALSTADLLKFSHAAHGINIDGFAFPISPTQAYATGKEIAVPFIIGSNAIELAAPGTPVELSAILQKSFQDLAPKALALYRLNSDSPPFTADPVYGDLNDQVGSDFFRIPGIIEGEWHSAAGNHTWQYEFSRAIPPHPKVSHSGELSYVFGNLSATGSQPGEFTAVDHALSATIQAYWTNFAKTGNPNGPGLPEWPAYDPKGRHYLQFTKDGEEKVSDDSRGPYAELYRELYKGVKADR